jgi:hypothetical protein
MRCKNCSHSLIQYSDTGVEHYSPAINVRTIKCIARLKGGKECPCLKPKVD